MRTLFKNARVFDPGAGIDHPASCLLVDSSVVQSLDADLNAQADRTIDCQGCLLIPGLVDLRAHFGEPGNAMRETLSSGMKAAAAGGFTTVLVMPTTAPTVDRVEVVEFILARARAENSIRILPAGALSVGREGERLAEMAKLQEVGCVAFTDADRAVRDSQLLRYAMETAMDIDVPVFTHAEDETLSLGGVMHEGMVSTRLGLRGVPGAAEVVGISRDLAIAELTGARLHICHVSTAAGVDLIRQGKRRGIRVTAEASPLHLLLTDEDVGSYDTSAKVFPPLRSATDVQATILGLADGTLDAVASDHNPQFALDKAIEFDQAAAGAVTLESTCAIVMTLVHEGRLTLERAVATLTRGPSQVLGLSDLGRIRVGSVADLVLVDPAKEWTLTRDEIRSKSSNTPLLGRTYRGQVLLTMARGKIVFER